LRSYLGFSFATWTKKDGRSQSFQSHEERKAQHACVGLFYLGQIEPIFHSKHKRVTNKIKPSRNVGLFLFYQVVGSGGGFLVHHFSILVISSRKYGF
jgi:hypothetical protein